MAFTYRAISPKREKALRKYEEAKKRYLASLLSDKPSAWFEYSLDGEMTPPDKHGHCYPKAGGHWTDDYESIPDNATIQKVISKQTVLRMFYEGWRRKVGKDPI